MSDLPDLTPEQQEYLDKIIEEIADMIHNNLSMINKDAEDVHRVEHDTIS